MTDSRPDITPPSDPELVQLGAVGGHVVWGDRLEEPLWLVIQDLPVSVCADGANGITRGNAARARELGLHIDPARSSVPLAAYHPSDLGSRAGWLTARPRRCWP